MDYQHTEKLIIFSLPEFSLVDENGDDVGAGIMGLLISNGGTVCDDNFSDNSADAICRKLGHYGHIEWESASGKHWEIQYQKEIILDEVDCDSEDWSSCSYQFDHDCEHIEDVFLQCQEFG